MGSCSIFCGVDWTDLLLPFVHAFSYGDTNRATLIPTDEYTQDVDRVIVLDIIDTTGMRIQGLGGDTAKVRVRRSSILHWRVTCAAILAGNAWLESLPSELQWLSPKTQECYPAL